MTCYFMVCFLVLNRKQRTTCFSNLSFNTQVIVLNCYLICLTGSYFVVYSLEPSVY